MFFIVGNFDGVERSVAGWHAPENSAVDAPKSMLNTRIFYIYKTTQGRSLSYQMVKGIFAYFCILVRRETGKE